MRPIPDRAASFIARHESLRLVAYDDLNPNRRSFATVSDVQGTPTIGYGHIRTVTRQDVVDRKRITQGQAMLLLQEDLGEAQAKLYRVVKPDVIESLTENQYAAILSFVFNLGANPGWTIWKRLNARQYDQVPAQMARFVNAGGMKLQGLVNRRNAEIALWSTAEPGSMDHTPPSSLTRSMPTPPTPVETKPLVKSNTFLTGAGTAVTGASLVASKVQEIAAPHVMWSDLVRNLVALAAVVVVACGILTMVLAWLKKREAQR